MKLENKRYRVEFQEKAAEIISFYDKELELEYIWEGDSNYWAGRNPILFPVIGSSYNKKYLIHGKEYEMGNHGFARNSMFTLVEQTENSLTLKLDSNEETLKQYPFEFTLTVTYTLQENELQVDYKIHNRSKVMMPFNFGLHPAFRCPLEKGESFKDYQVVFSNEVILNGRGPHSEQTLVSSIPLTYEAFKQYPTWSYHNVDASYIGYTNQKHGVWVSIVGYPIVAIWTAKEGAPFICLEPWKALGLRTEQDLPFEERDALLSLSPDHQYLTSYSIQVY